MFTISRIGRRRWPGIAALTLAITTAVAAAQSPAAPRLNKDRRQVAVQGYDVVAYFAAGRPTKGVADFTHDWQGARWQFSTPANRDLFAAQPEKYAPAYGGFCAYAVSRNYTADIDPNAWSVVNGRLFLNYSKGAQRLWLEDRDANIVKGDANWPALSRTNR
jgi:hypothetical protein